MFPSTLDFAWDAACPIRNPSGIWYYPKYDEYTCYEKDLSESELYDAEQYEKYVTKNQCCLEKFGNDVWTCCEEGDGECLVSGHTVYLPDWIMQTCKERDSALMSEWESTYASNSMESCCESFYGHDKKCGLGDTDHLYYPNHETSECLLKSLSEFETWENEVYEDLYDCCKEQFSNFT